MSLVYLDAPADIFLSRAQAIVVPTNCVGKNGAGLAKLAALRWPMWSEEYAGLCRRHPDKVRPGEVFPFYVNEGMRFGEARRVLAVPTKDHWRNPTKIAWVVEGLRNLAAFVEGAGYTSLAVPALGCGNGELNWSDVEPHVARVLGELADVAVEVYRPHAPPARRDRR